MQMWQIIFLVSTLDFLNCFMITISWYWPWNNKIRKTIIWSLLMSSLVSETWGVTFLRFFSFQPHQEFSPTKDKNKSAALCCWKKLPQTISWTATKQSCGSDLKSQRLPTSICLSWEPYYRLKNHKHLLT